MAKILVVDDEVVVCGSVGKILRKEGHEIECVLTAQEGLNLVEQERFDLIITDLMLPKMSGMEFLEIARRRWPGINVIMITGYATVKNAVQALKLGAFDFIPKPFTPDELRSAAARALERQRLANEEPLAVELPIYEAKDMYGIPEHSWVKIKEDHALVGIDLVFLKTVGEIINIEFPFKGDELQQGSVCARVIGNNRRIFAIWSPLSGKVVDVNYELNKDCSALNKDPYGAGWMLKIQPLNFDAELENLRAYPKQG